MKKYTLGRVKVQTLREVAIESVNRPVLDTPDRAAAYWNQFIATDPEHNPDVESLWVIMLSTRRHPIGHVRVSEGILDTLLVHPREVFRAACVFNAAALIVMHNHPSGDPTPSESDVKCTRDLMRAGQMMKIEVLDHVIVGIPSKDRPQGCSSLRELGYFYV